MNSLELITIYENVADITTQMVSAAMDSNWPLLASLEVMCSEQVRAIRDNHDPVQLERDEFEKKVMALKRILADDRRIRDITQPKLAQLNDMMACTGTQGKLARAFQLDHRHSV